MWDAETGEAIGAPFRGHDDLIMSVAFSHDSKRLISGSRDWMVRVWDVESGETIGAVWDVKRGEPSELISFVK